MKILTLIAALTALLTLPALGEVRMDAVNVGKGDAIIISDGEYSVLIDTGKGYACGKLRRALEERGIEKLDAVFITHVDNDHTEGLQFLAQSGIEVGAWYASPYFFEYKEKKHPIRKAGFEPEWLYAGDEILLGEMKFRALAPTAKNEDDEDENSLVMMLECPWGSILLAGDMESGEEALLLGSGAALKCDILKVANHGDGDTTGGAFVSAAQPEYAVISTSSYEKPDTPDAGVVALLESAGAEVFITQNSDAVTAVLSPDGISVQHSFWTVAAAYESVALSVDRENELFTVENMSGSDIDLGGWYLYSDSGNELFIFPKVALPAGGRIIVGTKSAPEGMYDIYWDEKNVISNKKDDLVTLYDKNGAQIAAAY